MIRRGLILAIAAIISVGTTACAQKREYKKAPRFESPAPKEFPIMASYAFYDPAFITHEKFKELNEAGFNIARQYLSFDLIDKTIAAVDGTGVKVMLTCWDIQDPKKTANVIRRYKDNPNVVAWFVKDEPSAKQFPDLKTVNDIILANDTNRMAFVNLFPKIEAERLGAKNYKAYVEEFVSEVNPQIISFDCYPVKVDGSGNYYVDGSYFETIETVSKVASDSQRPFWAYILSNKHWSYPKPSRDFLRFQVFTALAYGAQGLSYFTYCLPDYDKKGEITDAPLDRQGNKTDVWYMVRDVNREVHNLEKVFLGADVVGVWHTGVKLPSGTRRLRSAPGPFRWIASDGEGVLVSHLRNGDKEYVMIVNRDVAKRQRVRFDVNGSISRIDSDGTEKPERGSSVMLSPGGYAIYRIK